MVATVPRVSTHQDLLRDSTALVADEKQVSSRGTGEHLSGRGVAGTTVVHTAADLGQRPAVGSVEEQDAQSERQWRGPRQAARLIMPEKRRPDI